MRNSWLRSLAVMALAAVCASSASAGNLKGKFVLLEGKAPPPAKLKVDKDKEVCAAGGMAPVDESLVVGEDGGISNIIVTLFLKAGAKKPALPKGYAEAVKKPAELDNNKCRFEPRVTVVYAGQELILKNSDAVGHNVKANLLGNTPFNDLIPGGGKLSKTNLKVEEKLPAEASCSIHPWMRGYLVVREDPFVAVSAKDGSFEIKDLPPGEWTFRVWHERSGFVEEINLGGKATKWDKGRFEQKITDKDTDLGEIKVGIKEFPDK